MQRDDVYQQYKTTNLLRIRRETHQLYSEQPLDLDAQCSAMLDLTGEEALLDVGCGPGLFLRHLTAKGHRGRLVGLDQSPAMIAEAKHAAADLTSGLDPTSGLRLLPGPTSGLGPDLSSNLGSTPGLSLGLNSSPGPDLTFGLGSTSGLGLGPNSSFNSGPGPGLSSDFGPTSSSGSGPTSDLGPSSGSDPGFTSGLGPGPSSGPAIEWHEGAADALPFADREFAVLSARHMLYHVPDIPAALREFARVVGAGGVVLVATNGPRNTPGLADLEDAVSREFDLNESADPSRRFHTGIAPAMLRSVFPVVEEKPLPGALVFTDPTPIVDYVMTQSVPQQAADDPELFACIHAWVTAQATARLHARGGIWRDPKSVGLYRCVAG